jgi:hypothetical protein
MTDAEKAVREDEGKNAPQIDADSDPHPAGIDGSLDVVPGPGGYAGRDPKTEMPRMPSIPETQDDPGTHGASPDRKERPAGS